jgi:hypothetical protein
MPDKATLFRWLAANEHFRDQYTRAKEVMAEAMAEDILDISDDGTNDYYAAEDGLRPDTEHIQRSKLRVDTRKWLLSKLLPKKYGDKLELAGSKESPLTVQIMRQSDANDSTPR